VQEVQEQTHSLLSVKAQELQVTQHNRAAPTPSPHSLVPVVDLEEASVRPQHQ
jgi:hypothetical protein